MLRIAKMLPIEATTPQICPFVFHLSAGCFLFYHFLFCQIEIAAPRIKALVTLGARKH
jgi:hypothetical protein